MFRRKEQLRALKTKTFHPPLDTSRDRRVFYTGRFGMVLGILTNGVCRATNVCKPSVVINRLTAGDGVHMAYAPYKTHIGNGIKTHACVWPQVPQALHRIVLSARYNMLLH